MAFIQENTIEINIGLKNTYKLIQLSDVHAISYCEKDSKEVIEEAIKNDNTWIIQKKNFAIGANEYCDESYDIPSKQCLINLVNYVNEEKPVAAILTGDLIDYYSESNYDLLIDQISKLQYPFVFACGNHETPVDRYIDITCDENGFMVLECNEFKIVSLDNSSRKISKQTLNSLKRELRGKKPIIIAMHIPICTKYNRDSMEKYGPYFSLVENKEDEITNEFIDILISNEKIKAILCGHIHGTNESIFAPNKKQYCCSSGLIGKVNKIIVK